MRSSESAIPRGLAVRRSRQMAWVAQRMGSRPRSEISRPWRSFKLRNLGSAVRPFFFARAATDVERFRSVFLGRILMSAISCRFRAGNNRGKWDRLPAKAAEDPAISFLLLILHHFEPRLGRIGWTYERNGYYIGGFPRSSWTTTLLDRALVRRDTLRVSACASNDNLPAPRVSV
jgi:hypothetical protein